MARDETRKAEPVAGRDRSLIFFCLCGPGASGKSTISRQLVAGDPTLKLSISTTTRAPRGSEQDGVEYHFVSEEEFGRRVEQSLFLEHAAFGSKRYGTGEENLKDAVATGQDLILDIDVQGAAELKRLFGVQVVTVFVFPPSFAELEFRFRARGTDSEARIQERLQMAEEEIRRLLAPGFSDYLLLNGTLADSLEHARAIVSAERQRRARCSDSWLASIVSRG